MICPKCEAKAPARAKYCPQCRAEMAAHKALKGPVLPPKTAALLPRLPHVLALPLLEYAQETVPYVKLHRMCTATELLARFTATVLLADLLRQGEGRFPRDEDGACPLEGVLARHLAAPTFGSWRAIIEEALKTRPTSTRGSGRFVRELPALAQSIVDYLGSSKDDPKKEEDPKTKLIACRNLAAHSGRMSDAKARALLKAHRERFEGVFKRCALLGDYPLVARGSETALVKLMGATIPASLMVLPKDTVDKAMPGRLYLLSGDGKDLLDLSPLHTYQPVRVRTEDEFREIQTPPDPVPQVYFRAERHLEFLEYLTFAANISHGQDGQEALKRFKELFPLKKWLEEAARRDQAEGVGRKFTFQGLRHALQTDFVGRRECIKRMCTALEAKREGGIVWMTGKPGSGKSALMAKFLELLEMDDLKSTQRDKWVTVAHFFRAQEGHSCSRHAFFENALARLLPAADLSEAIEDEPRARELQFERVLIDLAYKEADRPAWPRSEREGRKTKPPYRRGILLFLDGIDELAASDPGFTEFIREHQPPGVVWFCAGQQQEALKKAFEPSPRCLHVFPESPGAKDQDEREGGIPRMSRDEIYEYLITACPSGGFELMRLDSRKPAKKKTGNRAVYPNPFLDAVVKKSEGLPLYLSLVAQDVREGRLTFRRGQEQDLPPSLRKYYDELLRRMQIGDLARAMTPLMMHLAVAKAPLTVDALHAFLKDVPELRGEEGMRLLKRALAFGHVMIRRAALPPLYGKKTPRLGHTIYHDSFREHLLDPRTKVVERSREVARETRSHLINTSPDC